MTIPSAKNLPPPPAPERLEIKNADSIQQRSDNWLLWLRHDPALIILFAMTLTLNLALFALLALRFEFLPDPLPLHFDASGLPDRIEARTGIFGLPTIGLVVFVVNFVVGIVLHRRERAATILIATGALLVQILLWVAAISIAGGFY